MRRIPPLLAVAMLACATLAFRHALAPRPLAAPPPPDFTHFESSQVRPACMTPDGTRLLVVNTPDDRLSVFDLTGPVPQRIAEIPVGLEPVSVACRSDSEAWVVNQLSDDISIVNLRTRHVRASLRVGDEPADVVFTNGPARAWVSVSQEDAVKVYDLTNLAAAPTVIAVNGHLPRALAVAKDGTMVLVDVFNSSGGSTVLSAFEAGDSLPAPNPPMSPSLPPRPKVGLIVRRNGFGNYVDISGKIWNSKIPYDEQMVELVYLSTSTLTVHHARGDIATVNMGLAISPVSGNAAVTGIYAFNEVQFEQHVAGHLWESRLALVPPTGARLEIGLNPQVNYAVTPGPQSERDSALGLPTGVAWSPDGQRVYVTALANDKLGVFDAAGALHARVSCVAGPTGIVADPARPRLYVVGRYHNQLQTLSTASLGQLALTRIGFDPTPDPIVNGRKFFYGGFTSGHGEQSCASCHLFGNLDGLAWDLGNPTGTMSLVPAGQSDPLLQPAHPMKGPMTTQSLRGMPGTGVLHWRGDRADLDAFNPAFVSLLGRATVLPDSEMAALDAFLLPLVYPPNPNQALDRTLPDAPPGQPSAKRGQTFFNTTVVDSGKRCVDCHALPSGTNTQLVHAARIGESQDFKVPQLRNLYVKGGFRDSAGVTKRGFGYGHDGAIDNLFDFLHQSQFGFAGTPTQQDADRRDVQAFLLAFDTGMAPAVGRQITFDGGNNGDATLLARLDTLVAQADAGNCELVAKTRIGTTPRGFLYGGGSWTPDMGAQPPLGSAALVALAAADHELTITGVPPGTGHRLGIDRDRDGFLDGDELAAGSDPGDPLSTPSGAGVSPPVTRDVLLGVTPNPFRTDATIRFGLARPAEVSVVVLDVLGRRVREVASGARVAGTHAVNWDGRRGDGSPASPGLYFVVLTTPAGRSTRAMVRLR